MNSFHSLYSRKAIRFALVVLTVLVPTSRADVVFSWNEAVLYFSIQARERPVPHVEVRALAIMHLAMADAVAAVVHAPKNDRSADQRVAAIRAAEQVAAALLPAGGRFFHEFAERQLASVPDGPRKVAALTAGERAATQALAARESDGWTSLAWFVPSTDASPAALDALVRGENGPKSPWLAVRPFGLKSAGQFPVAEMRTFKSDGNEVVNPALQSARTFLAVDRAAAVVAAPHVWADPSWRVWNRIARQAAAQAGVDLEQEARLLASVNVAMADALLAALHWRYTLGTWRAITVDVWERVGGRPELPTDTMAVVDNFERELMRFEPRRVLIAPVPNYPSVHATVAGAAQASLVASFKTDVIPFELPATASTPEASHETVTPRMFGTLSSAGREAAFVASLDGRTLREACVAGYDLGTAIGSYLGKRQGSRRR